MVEYNSFQVELEIKDKILGGVPASKELVQPWLRGRGVKAETEKVAEEISERLPDEGELVTTVFERGDFGSYKDMLCLHERHIKGLIKEASRALGLANTAGFGSFITHNITVEPQLIPIAPKAIGIIESTGHVMGFRGPRAILKRSEYVDSCKVKFKVKVLKPLSIRGMVGRCYNSLIENIEEIFKAGETIGLGKDRALGHGRYELIEIKAE